MIFETERLKLRELNIGDFKDLAEILQDKNVVYAYEHDFSDREVHEWMERQFNRYLKYGFGLWAVELKGSGEMIGQAGLTIQPYNESEVLEIGYLLKKKFWHKGYAIESAMGCKEYAFEVLKADKVYSIIKSDNYPSIRVAKSIGMSKESEFYTQYYGTKSLHYLFSVSKK